MIRLSHNVLTAAGILLQRMETFQFSSLSELAYSRIASISTEDIFEFASVCKWVSVEDNKPIITKRGDSIGLLQKQGALCDAQRLMLEDYVINAVPIWSGRIPYGRREASIFMTKDESACFTEAGLLTEQLDTAIIEWWDRIAARIRLSSQRQKSDIGRIGERNTVEFEKRRTGVQPKWVAIESNLAGYDVQSRIGQNDPTLLLIEAKTSTSPLSDAQFHVTSHEWNVALTSTAYQFHLWCISETRKLLAIITPDEVFPYIPTNNLKGEWESAKIPFDCFRNNFVDIT